MHRNLNKTSLYSASMRLQPRTSMPKISLRIIAFTIWFLGPILIYRCVWRVPTFTTAANGSLGFQAVIVCEAIRKPERPVG